MTTTIARHIAVALTGAAAAALMIAAVASPASAASIIPSDSMPAEVIADSGSLGVPVAASPTAPVPSSHRAGPRAVASLPRGIVVTNHGGKPVALFATGQRPIRQARPGNAPATFTGLAAGTEYTVIVGDTSLGKVRAVNRPSAATRLLVHASGPSGTVRLTWRYRGTRATGGSTVTFDLAATGASATAVTGHARGTRSATLTGLDLDTLYTFSVTPVNSAGKSRVTSATMTRTLAQLTGAPTPTTPVPAAPTPTPTPVPTPVPAPAPAPATRTIYVCPDGFTDTGSLCQKTAPYTYDTKAYTYHTEFVTTGSHVEYSASPNGGTYYAAGNPRWDFGPAGYYKVVTDGYPTTVKDATPDGYTDTGTNWIRRNPAPAGYHDDGTQWVLTVPREARVVPA